MSKVCWLLLCFSLFAGGCVTSATKLGEVQLGMSKLQVVAILGEPASVSASPDGELLRYQLRGSGPLLSRPDGRVATGYTVQLQNGKVVAYGRDDEFRAISVRLQ